MRVLALLSVSALAACVAGAPGSDVLDAATRELARSAVNSEMSRRLPGVNVQPYTDCVIDNSTTAELVSLARAGASSDLSQVAGTVGTVVQRPETSQCLSTAALRGLGG
ncbi:hypothetical protein [Pseudogemmobacter sonorensis]|uniref:hypothetical protein n=1 Tax=Pseudogemmobacter sonorensis TaxID=2989681 RepID=UPI003693CACB